MYILKGFFIITSSALYLLMLFNLSSKNIFPAVDVNITNLMDFAHHCFDRKFFRQIRLMKNHGFQRCSWNANAVERSCNISNVYLTDKDQW